MTAPSTGPGRRFIASALVVLFLHAAALAAVEPVSFTVRFQDRSNHIAEVRALYPTDGSGAIELMMPIWSPGYYRVENHAGKVEQFSARASDGSALEVTRPRTNRWRIQTTGRAPVQVTYRLRCEGRSVTTDWVGEDYAVLNGGATFPALLGTSQRPYEVKLELAPGWEGSMTALGPAPGGLANHYRAADYDTLVDSPIVAGKLKMRQFAVEGVPHILVGAGEFGNWNIDEAASKWAKVVQEVHDFWGELPFQRYVLLDVFRRGGGGLEHLNSALLTSRPGATAADASWAEFVCHEYFHAFNVKRLRPTDLDTFDYENPPRTSGLWISEGLTTYYGELLPCRAGISSATDFLSFLSSSIERLQRSPGRLAQSLEQASLDVWNTPTSGLARDANTNTISYYVKGPVVGWLLDARIQHATGGRKTLDDLMRLAYRRYSGKRGFTAEQFCQTAGEVAGGDLKQWFQKNVSSTEELDYSEALEWFGLRFAAGAGPTARGKLESDPGATPAQKASWHKLTGPSRNHK